MQGGMELGAGRALDAVIGPEGLLAVTGADLLEYGFPLVGVGEGVMTERMPVLGEDNVLEARGDGVDYRDDLVAARHGQSAAGAEVILHVDDEEEV